MSRYHSICEECGFEDPNDDSVDYESEDYCGHYLWEIIDMGSDDHEQA